MAGVIAAEAGEAGSIRIPYSHTVQNSREEKYTHKQRKNLRRIQLERRLAPLPLDPRSFLIHNEDKDFDNLLRGIQGNADRPQSLPDSVENLETSSQAHQSFSRTLKTQKDPIESNSRPPVVQQSAELYNIQRGFDMANRTVSIIASAKPLCTSVLGTARDKEDTVQKAAITQVTRTRSDERRQSNTANEKVEQRRTGTVRRARKVPKFAFEPMRKKNENKSEGKVRDPDTKVDHRPTALEFERGGVAAVEAQGVFEKSGKVAAIDKEGGEQTSSNSDLKTQSRAGSSETGKKVMTGAGTGSTQPTKRTPRKLKMELPMILMGETIPSTADSGSEENIISNEVILALGLIIDDAPQHQREFRMGNNRIVIALGRIVVACTFARDQSVQLQCCFYVFQTLIAPLIMGMAFLDETETLTKNKHRLQPRNAPLQGPLVCASLNNPRRRLRCFVVPEGVRYVDRAEKQKCKTLVNADTGSELDLVSLDFCMRRNLGIRRLDEGYSEIQFADGSIGSLVGQVKLRVPIGRWTGDVLGRTFYVFPDLTCDMLFGEEFLDEFDAFDTYRDTVYLEDDLEIAQVSTIVWLRAYERLLLWPLQSRRQNSHNDTLGPEMKSSEVVLDAESGVTATTAQSDGDQNVENSRSGLEEVSPQPAGTQSDGGQNVENSGSGLGEVFPQPAATQSTKSPHSRDLLNTPSGAASVSKKMSIVKSVYNWLLAARRRAVHRLRHPPPLATNSEPDLDAQIDELDARENRRREEVKRMIESLPPQEKANATELEVEKGTAFYRDRGNLICLRDKYKVNSVSQRAS